MPDIPRLIPPDHPCAGALRLAEGELAMGRRALEEGNEGKARVCGRRAVGIFIQNVAPMLQADYGPHVMANLRAIEADISLPDEIRSAAARLLGGARSIAADGLYSAQPLADAVLVIDYFTSALASSGR